MPPQASAKSKPKRARRNNKRTQVSSTSSSSSSSSSESTSSGSESESESSSASSGTGNKQIPKLSRRQPSAGQANGQTSSAAANPSLPRTPRPSGESQETDHVQDAPNAVSIKSQAQQPNDEFEQWYLRTITQELGEDLAKLREAPDFKDSSIPVLIRALRQGAESFTEDDKKLIMGAR